MSGFYKQFKEEKFKNQMLEQARQAYNLEENRPVIISNNRNKASIFFHYVGDFFIVTLKILMYVVAVALSSVGLTALINQPIREQLIKLLIP